MPYGCLRSLRQIAQASAKVAPNTGGIGGKPLTKSVKIIESEFLESIPAIVLDMILTYRLFFGQAIAYYFTFLTSAGFLYFQILIEKPISDRLNKRGNP